MAMTFFYGHHSRALLSTLPPRFVVTLCATAPDFLPVEVRVDVRGTKRYTGVRNVRRLPRVRGVHAAQSEPAHTPSVRLVLWVRHASSASVADV